MKIYISGISGTGMGPLALMAKAAGMTVYGSDKNPGMILPELEKAGIEVKIGEQDGEFLKQKINEGVDWFVYTSALPKEHPELVLAKETGIKISKRDELTEYLIEKLGLKMVAVAGTHGKTTTTSMITFGALKLGIKAAYIVGTTLGFAPSGSYKPGDEFFIYEADEYDRNFLMFHPWLAVFPSVTYDHPDIYPTREDYEEAFSQFKAQCENVIDEINGDVDFKLAGAARRRDAELAMTALLNMKPDLKPEEVKAILDEFPGVGRRFERLADGFYTDYAHHPEEIEATIDVAKDEARLRGKKGVIVVYQPHQNTRQHEVKDLYKDAFKGVEKIFWIPTYLTREDPNLKVLTAEDLISILSNKEVAEPAELNDELFGKLVKYRDEGYLILLMTAGPADGWLRKNVATL